MRQGKPLNSAYHFIMATGTCMLEGFEKERKKKEIARSPLPFPFKEKDMGADQNCTARCFCHYLVASTW